MLEELPAETERETIERDLARVGFGEAKVTRALDWLADLAEFRNGTGPGPSALAFRAFNASEMRRLDADCRACCRHWNRAASCCRRNAKSSSTV